MNAGSAGLRRWTQRFAVASAGSLVLTVLALGVDRRLAALVGLFGFVCPMVFGMAYLLVPPYVGRTLADHRLAGVHFALAYAGAGLLVADELTQTGLPVRTVGAALWSLGVAVFVGALALTVGPALRERPTAPFGSGDRPQRSSKAATAAIPVAFGYLLVGTAALLASGIPGTGVTSAQVHHFYAAGFGALLVFALGARLLVGFFHATPPRSLLWVTLAAGAVGPALLGTFLWIGPWFHLGAALTAVAMAGYAAVVAAVARRTDRTSVGLYAIAAGAGAGVLGVAAALYGAVGDGGSAALHAHVTFVLGGFFPLTIAGYAFQFFPVTTGQFAGATERGAGSTVALLAAGVLVQGVGALAGIALSCLGALGYAYLLARRFRG